MRTLVADISKKDHQRLELAQAALGGVTPAEAWAWVASFADLDRVLPLEKPKLSLRSASSVRFGPNFPRFFAQIGTICAIFPGYGPGSAARGLFREGWARAAGTQAHTVRKLRRREALRAVALGRTTP